jgi:hypothetical protein
MTKGTLRTKTFSSGSTEFDHLEGDNGTLPQILSVALSFEQAAALAVAINARLYDLSKIDRSTKNGAREGMLVSVYCNAGRIGVNKGRTRAHATVRAEAR